MTDFYLLTECFQNSQTDASGPGVTANSDSSNAGMEQV